MKTLSDWKWAIDYSRVLDKASPEFFTSREKAQKANKNFPKGRVVKVKITILKK